ncbi:undecaprenyl-diphosphate phosphatase [Alphaproteobacteria bacterium]|nr:undecaprenyl-diphosphate phosphatase [Alphaproteobacteria bacterium]
MTTDYLFYSFYSIIQGITEFIPISSSGHLNLLELLYNRNDSRNYLYETTAHFASLLALIFYLYRQNHLAFHNIKLNFIPITLATIPAIIVGVLMKFYNISFFSLQIIGYTSIIGGLLLYLSDLKFFQILKISNTKTKFLVAGLFQCLAFLPGFSRSGSCMIAFRMMGEDRKNSSVLSLYLGMPLILISFLSNIADLEEIKFDFNLLIILVVTFVFAYLTLKLFINFINNIGFKPFVIYRLIFGLLILTLLG